MEKTKDDIIEELKKARDKNQKNSKTYNIYNNEIKIEQAKSQARKEVIEDEIKFLENNKHPSMLYEKPGEECIYCKRIKQLKKQLEKKE